jgi:transcriptional regulator with XRE-family HTH domain
VLLFIGTPEFQFVDYIINGMLHKIRVNMLGWSQSDLSEASKTATKTIADFERGAREPYALTLEDVQDALEKAGVEFIAENRGGPGVRLRKSS